MSNPVFETALATILQALEDVEAEVGRLRGLEVRAQGTQQRLDAMQVQEREMKATLSGLAASVTAAQRKVETAIQHASDIVNEGEKTKAQIIADAHKDAGLITADGQRGALALLEQAKNDAAQHTEKVAKAKQDLTAIAAQQNEILRHIESAQNEFKRIKQSAAAFAGE
jgi:hypothetical protein